MMMNSPVTPENQAYVSLHQPALLNGGICLGTTQQGLGGVSECASCHPAAGLCGICGNFGSCGDKQAGPTWVNPSRLLALYSVLFSCFLPVMAGVSAVSPPPSHPLHAQLGWGKCEPGPHLVESHRLS